MRSLGQSDSGRAARGRAQHRQDGARLRAAGRGRLPADRPARPRGPAGRRTSRPPSARLRRLASRCPPPEPRVSAYGRARLCAGPLRGCLGSLKPCVSLRRMNPPIFTAPRCGGSSPQRWSSVSTPVGAGPARFAPSLLLLPVSRGRLYVLSYRTPVQPVFGWSSRLTVCKFSCNFDVLKGETSTMFTASAILTGTF